MKLGAGSNNILHADLTAKSDATSKFFDDTNAGYRMLKGLAELMSNEQSR
jgi:hypothetical protein